jgi:hypothetical protein
LARYATIGDYILVRNFGFGTAPAAEGGGSGGEGEGGALRAVPPAGFRRAVTWAANDFPYHVSAGIEHHLVWSAGSSDSDAEGGGGARALSQAEVDACVAAHRDAAEWETLTFVNPVRLQSVTNVWHAHCMSRLRRRSGEGDA